MLFFPFGAIILLLSTIYQLKLTSNRPLHGKYRSQWQLFEARDENYFASLRSYRNLKELLPDSFKVQRIFREADLPIQVFFPFESILHEMPPDEVQNEVLACALAEEKDGHIPTPVYLGRTDENLPESFVLDRPGGKRQYRWRFSLKQPKQTELKHHLKKLRRRMKDPETRFVLSLGGGGLRLFAHASVMKVIDMIEGRSHIDELWGCSGGSIAGLGYAMGVTPVTIEKEGYDLYNERYDILISPSKSQVIKNIAVEWLFPSNPFVMKGFVDIQKTIHDTVNRLTKGQELQIPFYAIAYNLHHKRNEVLTPVKTRKQDYGDYIHTVPAIDAVLASSSIPILYVPRIIKKGKTSHLYVDGGTAEEVPLVSIYRKWKLDQKKKLTDKKKLFILAVNLFPQVSGWKIFRNKIIKKLPFIDILKWSGHVADLMRRARIEDHLHVLREDPHVEVLEIVLPMKGPGVLNPKTIPKIISGAHSSFIKQLLNFEQGKGQDPIKFET